MDIGKLLNPFSQTPQKASSDSSGNPFSRVFSFLQGNSAPPMNADEYVRAYKGWVYACTTVISENVAQMDLKLQKLQSDGEWEDIKDTGTVLPLMTLRHVNKTMTHSDLLQSTQSFLELTGDCFWWLPRGGLTQKPAEVWILPADRMTVVKSQKDFVGGYVYLNDKNEQIPLTTDEVIHFKRFHPFNRYRGMGTVEAAALAIDTDTFSSEFNKNFFYNAAMPSATLETDGAMTPEQLERIKAEWESRYTGVRNAHKMAILWGGLKFKPVQLSQKDMDFLEGRKFTRDEILAMFRVPKSLLGLTDDVNRANAEATEYIFAKYVIKPRMQFIVDRLTEFFLPKFGLDTNKYRFALVNDPVPQNEELELKRKETSVNKWMTIDEVRELEGREPLPNNAGKVLYLPSTVAPVTGKTPEETPEGEEDDTTGENEGKALVPLLVKDVKKNIKSGEERFTYINNKIQEVVPQYEAIFQDVKERAISALTPQKSLKKDITSDELIRLLIAELGEDVVSQFKDKNREVLEDTYSHAGTTALAELTLDLTFDLKHERALAWLEQNALYHAASITNTLKDEMKVRIIAGVETGLGASDIASSISEFFDDQSHWRAERIARTEVITAYAEGSLEGYRQSNVVQRKEWLTGGDDRVESLCLQNESQGAIPLEESFSSGHKAPPAHPNCRCSIVPVVEE